MKYRWVEGANAWEKAEAEPFTRTVWLPRPTNMRNYLSALHELGHICDPEAYRLRNYGQDARLMLAMESYAWGWGFNMIAPEVRERVTKSDIVWMGKCIASHLDPGWD